jgi:site-specific recombinase XerD
MDSARPTSGYVIPSAVTSPDHRRGHSLERRTHHLPAARVLTHRQLPDTEPAVHGPENPSDRAVFVRAQAPYQPLRSNAVTTVVVSAARRAGVGLVGAHRLRHSAATAMLRSGGSLIEIGQVLRHVRPLTTALYAKVDIEALRQLTKPWPGELA